MAIERDVLMVAAPREDRQLRGLSLEQDAVATADLDALQKKGAWFDYVAGCADVLQKAGHTLPGADIAVTGNVPLGSGLSSSAALEVATMHTLAQLGEFSADAD